MDCFEDLLEKFSNTNSTSLRAAEGWEWCEGVGVAIVG